MQWTKKINPSSRYSPFVAPGQWISGEYSIIEPSPITFHAWEAYNGSDIERFESLEEAKAYCKADNNF